MKYILITSLTVALFSLVVFIVLQVSNKVEASQSPVYVIEQWENSRWVKIGETQRAVSSYWYDLNDGSRYTPAGKWRIYEQGGL